MEQVARYTARNPFAQEQLEVSDNGMVVFHHRGKPSPSGQDQEVLHPLEFLARACQHIPDAYEPRTFFFGLYSCRSRARERRVDRHPAGSDSPCSTTPDTRQPDTPFRRQCRKRWAELIRKVWLDDPLICSQCGGSMRIISFITVPPVIDKIIDPLGLDHPDPPEPIAHAPPIDSLGTC